MCGGKNTRFSLTSTTESENSARHLETFDKKKLLSCCYRATPLRKMAARVVQQKASNTAVQRRDFSDGVSGKARERPLPSIIGYYTTTQIQAALLRN